MALNSNMRLYWAVVAAGIAPDGSNTFTRIKGLQSIGLNTNFTLNDIFEIGQLEAYDRVEDLPEIEVSLEKVLDGSPLLYHLATPTATSPTLAGRSSKKCTFGMSLFSDVQDSASGTPNAQVVCSGMFYSNLSYTLPTDGELRESLTLVGNNKVWKTSGFTFTGGFNNNDTPPSGIQRRQHVVMGLSGSQLPFGPGGLPGVTSGGWNIESNGKYGSSVQSINISANVGRENLLELGRKNPYFKYVTFPVDVTCEIVVNTTDGDLIDATENGYDGKGNNLYDQTIDIKIQDGTRFNLGAKNKLQSVSYGGADAGGGNATVTYTYGNKNSLKITQPNDPASLT